MNDIQSWLIGADPSCDLVVDQPTVSGRHCRLTQTADGFVLDDLKSRNGTFVNGQKIEGTAKVTRADTITLGRSVPMPWPAAAASEPTPAAQPKVLSSDHSPLTPSPSPAARERGGQIGPKRPDRTDAELSPPLARQQHKPGQQQFTSLRVEQRTTTIGRDGKACDLVLDDPRVSRRHAQLTRSGDAFTVEDLQSANGTFVNGLQIKAPHPLRPGDIVALGNCTFKLTPSGELEQRDYRGNVTIEAQGLSIDVPGKRLLEGISLTVYPSEFVGLMGPSGAGKTTLMNALNGYTPPSAGHVLFNGRDLYANYAEFQGVIGYVPQDDIMHGDLTVGQALYYSARLRLPADFSDAEIRTRIEQVMAQLGLSGTQNVLIGSPTKKGISGGQRKRVNLAMELLTDPAVLFLDEPTSGLSSEDALMVMKLLRKLADDGKTIILTVHQPSLEAYRQLDNLILVSKDAGSPEPGRLVYYGPAYPQAVDFFNPQGVPGLRPGAEPSPDEVLRGLGKEKTAHWAQQFAGSFQKREYVDARTGRQPAASGEATSSAPRRGFGLLQGWTLIQRALAVKWKDTANTAILLAQAPIIAALVVLVFGRHASEAVTTENWPSVASATATTVFLLALAGLWFGCSNSAREIVGEWSIYHRERMVTLKIPSYVASKLAVLGGLCLLQCAVLQGIVCWGAGLKGPWLGMFAVLLLTSLVGLAIGLTVSAVAKTSEVAIALLPLILLPMVILAGVLQPLHKMNSAVAAVAQAMPSRWAFEGLLLLESQERPTWTPPALPTLPPGTPGAAPQPKAKAKAEKEKAQDMAERFFPAEDQRMGTNASRIALVAMLTLLVALVHGILRWRDVH